MMRENEKCSYENNSQDVIERNVGSHIAAFSDEVNVLLAADTSVKPED